ncbi:tRNA (adenosine(37)-N6)-dimethylallyltransferase MiaA, partial [Candidatus Desantisbacteria bacterium]|nr:tRNA (adenosine(37)-N6)-dimethylallyltransferase MiaA [Candidatus Desantisbacteria bacterium]
LIELKRKGYDINAPGLNGIGYKELYGYLNDEYSLIKAIELIKQNTRRYAKRQMTWSNHMEGITWFDIDNETNYEEIADRIIKEIK